jgi:hypothetical protein
MSRFPSESPPFPVCPSQYAQSDNPRNHPTVRFLFLSMQIVKCANFYKADPTAFRAYNQFPLHWEKMNTKTAIRSHNANKYLPTFAAKWKGLVVGSCCHWCSDLRVPDGIEEGHLQHTVSDINCYERPATENCDVHPKKTTLDITFHLLSNWDSVVPVHNWGIGFNIFTCVIKIQQLVEKSH